jgi:hypothetical protein
MARHHAPLRADIERLAAEGSERCSLCRKPFDHNVALYAGVADHDAIAVVGDCCVHRMKAVYAVGASVKRTGLNQRRDA